MGDCDNVKPEEGTRELYDKVKRISENVFDVNKETCVNEINIMVRNIILHNFFIISIKLSNKKKLFMGN